MEFLGIVWYKKMADYGTNLVEKTWHRRSFLGTNMAIRSPSAHSSKGRDFHLDNTKICHPMTTVLANEFQYCSSQRWQTWSVSSRDVFDQEVTKEEELKCPPFGDARFIGNLARMPQTGNGLVKKI